MAITLKSVVFILISLKGTSAGEFYIEEFIYDMLELTKTMDDLRNATNKINELENKVEQLNEELEAQKNKTKGKESIIQ